MSEQHRKLQRQELNTTILIRDAMSRELIGELANITIEGLMIISDQQMGTNSIYQFCLELPEAIKGQSRIDLGVDCLWSRSTENVSRHWSGYQIIDASPEALETIDALISGYAQ